MTTVANLVQQTTSTTGTGNLTLTAADGRQTFNSAFGTGGTDVFYYFVMNRAAAEWEVGTGHLFDSTTLVRDTVLNSSNANAAVNFSAGTKDVTNAVAASDIAQLVNLASTANGKGASLIGIEDSGTLITATTVEGALAENRTAIDALEAANTGDVTLAGTPDYITIAGQVITRNAVDLAADVTGTLPVTNGGTGRATGTTAYSLIATGTTATGAQQTLANGATTKILVGGGAAALPVWTTATGSGAPVRATSPTLVTPHLGTPASGTLTNCSELPVSGITSSTSTALGVGSIELGHASDTTIARVSAGVVSVEGVNLAFDTFVQGGTGAATRTIQDKLRDVIHVSDFGAVGDGSTDDTAAIQAAITYAKTLSATVGGGSTDPLIGEFTTVHLDGLTYAITSPLDFNDARYIIFTGGHLIAVDDGATNWTTSNAMIHVVDTGGSGTYGTNNIHIENVSFDCKYRANAIRFNTAYRCKADRCTIDHMMSAGFGIKLEANCNLTRVLNCVIHEDTSTDLDGGDNTRAATGIIVDGSGDVWISGNDVGWVNEGIYINNSSKVFISDNHLYCGSNNVTPGTEHEGNVVNITSSGNDIVISGNYLDSGYVKLASNRVTICDNFFYQNGAGYTQQDAYIVFTTASAGTYVYPQVHGNTYYGGLTDIWKFETTGSGSYATGVTAAYDTLTPQSAGSYGQPHIVGGSDPLMIINPGSGDTVVHMRSIVSGATTLWQDKDSTVDIQAGALADEFVISVNGAPVCRHNGTSLNTLRSGGVPEFTSARTDTHGVGYIHYRYYRGKNASAGDVDYAASTVYVDDDTVGSEDAALTWQTMVAGTRADRMVLRSGLVVGSPTGGDKGAGTINAVGVYDDNVLLTDYVFDTYLDGGIAKADAGNERASTFDPSLLDISAFSDKWKLRRALPAMPTRAEWTADGTLSVGDLAQRLWETVEIQAVHIAQLNDRLQKLEAN